MSVNHPKGDKVLLSVLLFIQWMGIAAWIVPLTLVLNAHGLAEIRPYAFATSAVAAFISPLFFGAMADRHMAPTRVLRWLCVATAAAVTLASTAIARGWNPWCTLGLILIYSLCAAPTVSISTAIVLGRSTDPRRQFGPIRAVGTIGWMAGGVLISALNADASTLAGFSSAALWLILAAFTNLLPDVPPPASTTLPTWHERLGLDALMLLRNPDHRVVFLTACLLNIPLAAFYPYTPLQLRDLGFAHPSAWMSLAQVTEIIAMFLLGTMLARWRLKWILLLGLGFGVLRYVLCSFDDPGWVLAGLMLHGCTYTLFYITAQIYVNERVESGWRTRGQALFTLMNSGVGYLIGYLGCGAWYRNCTDAMVTRWLLFWAGLAGAVALVALYFLTAYHGRGTTQREGPQLANPRETHVKRPCKQQNPP